VEKEELDFTGQAIKQCKNFFKNTLYPSPLVNTLNLKNNKTWTCEGEIVTHNQELEFNWNKSICDHVLEAFDPENFR
jgi:hypothetical protein